MDRPKKVLVIDDEEIVRTCCQRVLGPLGYEVDTATDGVEGLRLINRQEYDVVFTDIKMPGVEGHELITTLKRLSPDTKVVVVTGYATEETREEANRAGADEFIEKPFCPSGILEAVRRT